ncbi:MAG TPA: DUF3368 domain-containing protein [Leptospiraceae bacterium]|nr:DUF3368 domain-containing protein [Leptospiraceae bacterium]HNF16163.1 DUF3368 domain-containing protein [Leptospiraceae bacterium]HNI95029.1 DUF3368 domain-containing protein [Leptospiraceae bacterium]HNM03388.1 DUF3368 domain-containing protein [Leptospiraceae bacterium]HNN03924.1 DUF3368 domain-containing protein [Leptospiraceae bacterium]
MTVSNTTPLINFYSIQRLDILEKLFQRIIIPEAVANEIREKEKRFSGVSEILNSSFIEVHKIKNYTFANNLKIDVDDGEAEAIVLSIELEIRLIILDELSARSLCKYHNLYALGSIGCLVLAKEKDIISSIRPFLDGFREKGNFWIKESLYESILKIYE